MEDAKTQYDSKVNKSDDDKNYDSDKKIKLPVTKDMTENLRVEKLIQKAGNSNVGELIKKFKPAIDAISLIFEKLAPYVTLVWSYLHYIYSVLPIDLFRAFLGLILVFYGGFFVVTISAVEAFYLTGWEKFWTSFIWLRHNFLILWEKSREDDRKDEDNDGVADVLQINAKELFTRKVAFFFAECTEPQKFMDMISAISTSLVGVYSVLKVEFAKTIALGITVGDFLRKPAAYFLVPILSTALPKKYHQWISPGINLICKSVALTIAWFIQKIISTVQSAIRGGLLFSRRILKYFNDKGYIQFNDEQSYLDEIIGWFLAFYGIYFQLNSMFILPFPLNWLLFPFTMFENWLIWIIS
jgi:hypothetical protein